METLKNIDILSYNPSIYVNGRKRDQSIFGVIISLLAIVLCIGGAVYLALQFLGRSKMKLNSSMKIVTNDHQFMFSNESISLFVGVMSKNFKFIVNPTIFTVDAIKMTKEGAEDGIESSVEISECNKYYTQDDIVETSHKFEINNFFCIKPNASEIRGYWGGDTPFALTKVFVRRCINSTENNNHCKSTEEIDTTIQGSTLIVYSSTYFFNPNNYTNPFDKFFLAPFYYLNANSSWELNLIYQQTTLYTDDAFLFYNSKEETRPTLSNENNFINYRIERSDVFASLNLEITYVHKEYLRTYMKIQEVLTQIGGLTKAIYLIALILVRYPSQVLFYISKATLVEQQSVNIINPVPKAVVNISQSINQAINSRKDFPNLSPVKKSMKKGAFFFSCFKEIICCKNRIKKTNSTKYTKVKKFYENVLSIDNMVEKFLLVDLFRLHFNSLDLLKNETNSLVSFAIDKYDVQNKTSHLNLQKEDVTKFFNVNATSIISPIT